MTSFLPIFCVFLQLNDVGSGGRTVFPRIGAGVAPVAGSAVFWYNLFPSGDADQLTLHGACPVLYGTKWGKLMFKCFCLLWKRLFSLQCRTSGFAKERNYFVENVTFGIKISMTMSNVLLETTVIWIKSSENGYKSNRRLGCQNVSRLQSPPNQFSAALHVCVRNTCTQSTT